MAGLTPSRSATIGWDPATLAMSRWASASPIRAASGSTPTRRPWSRTSDCAYEW